MACHAQSNLQKIADAADFGREELTEIIERYFGSVPFNNPRLWEFASAFHALDSRGFLDGSKRGLAMGAGREPLIFPVSERSNGLIVTDLYDKKSIWTEARTSDPADFVLSEAPAGFDARRISVRSMDMRQLDVATGSIDFAYSISSFEHIGRDADFVAHLKEVARVLNSQGVYVLTTELRIGGPTHDIAGNYAFAIDHLLALIEQSGLNPDPVIDLSLTSLGANQPKELSRVRGVEPPSKFEELIVRETGGIMSLPVLLILRPGRYVAPQIVGLDETAQWLNDGLRRRSLERNSDWRALNPFAALPTGRSPYVEPWPADAGGSNIVFSTSYQHFAELDMEARITLAAAGESNGTTAVAIMSWSTVNTSDMSPLETQTISIGGSHPVQTIGFRFSAKPHRCYSIYGLAVAGAVRLASITVMVRKAIES
ncbi:class I SAM-dependent methyltransferase [Rhodoplanes sp. Z2-YC6860]|uniref:class I SAM-dependent methyltransferase n=1 Tax=Rhodoplanes sp. Z2-YC6860 TaxID=674703 RepID=UPI00078D2BA3|nr:class I SAM-dependent methyltransferase [Rhodoplanes sp. Z2-YC6860]AMN41837.1 methyltransferase type 11 [Rhodoplanes sp. Z2-YC6860]